MWGEGYLIIEGVKVALWGNVENKDTNEEDDVSIKN